MESVDQCWIMCCALHNWLFDIDGLSCEWNNGNDVRVNERELGDMDSEGLREEVPNAIAGLSTNLDPRNFKLSRMGRGEDVFAS